MIFHLPLLKTALLWLTTAVGVLAAAPRFECVCPNGTRQTLLFTASAKCCAKPAPAASGAAKAEAPVENQCPKCHAPKPERSADDVAGKRSESPCRKSMIAADAAIAPATADAFAFEVAGLPQSVELPSYVVHAESLKRSLATGQAPPPADLVITLRHLVI